MQSLSDAIHDVGRSLVHLNLWANEKDATCVDMVANQAVFDISQIQRRLRGGIRELLDRCGFIYAGGNAGAISVCGRSYASAHQAVIGEAIGLITFLWISLDVESYQHLRAADPDRWKLPSRIEELKKLNDATGFDPSCVTKQWDHAKDIVASVLSEDWMRDFKPLLYQLQRERAWAIANNMPTSESFLDKSAVRLEEKNTANATAAHELPTVVLGKSEATVTFLGKEFAGVDLVAAEGLKAIIDNENRPTGLTAIIGKNPNRKMDKLPAILRRRVKSAEGKKGYYFDLRSPAEDDVQACT